MDAEFNKQLSKVVPLPKSFVEVTNRRAYTMMLTEDITSAIRLIRENGLEALFFDFFANYESMRTDGFPCLLYDLYKELLSFPVEELTENDGICIYVHDDFFSSLSIVTAPTIKDCLQRIDEDRKKYASETTKGRHVVMPFAKEVAQMQHTPRKRNI